MRVLQNEKKLCDVKEVNQSQKTYIYNIMNAQFKRNAKYLCSKRYENSSN